MHHVPHQRPCLWIRSWSVNTNEVCQWIRTRFVSGYDVGYEVGQWIRGWAVGRRLGSEYEVEQWERGLTVDTRSESGYNSRASACFAVGGVPFHHTNVPYWLIENEIIYCISTPNTKLLYFYAKY